MRRREVSAGANVLGQNIIVLSSFDQHFKTGIGKSRAGVLGDGNHNPLITTLDQDVGDRRTERWARRDGKKMRLALGPCGGDEILIGESCGGGEQGSATATRSSDASTLTTLI